MLVGVDRDTIIAGAYSAGPAICPALAAHRRGAHTRYSDFASAWDRYARGRGIRRARHDDLASLVAMLRSSLATELPGRWTRHGPPLAPGGNGNGNGRARIADAVLPSGSPEPTERDGTREVV